MLKKIWQFIYRKFSKPKKILAIESKIIEHKKTKNMDKEIKGAKKAIDKKMDKLIKKDIKMDKKMAKKMKKCK